MTGLLGDVPEADRDVLADAGPIALRLRDADQLAPRAVQPAVDVLLQRRLQQSGPVAADVREDLDALLHGCLPIAPRPPHCYCKQGPIHQPRRTALTCA